MTMVVVKMLKRKDASAVVVAIAVGILLATFVSNFTNVFAQKLSMTNSGAISWDWRSNFLMPAVLLAVELIGLEVLTWVYVWLSELMKQK